MFVYQERGSNGVSANGMRLFSTIEQICEYIVRLDLKRTFERQPDGPNQYYRDNATSQSSYHKMPQTDVWLKQSLHLVRVTLLLPGELAPEAKLLNKKVLWDKIVELKMNEFHHTQIMRWIESKTP